MSTRTTRVSRRCFLTMTALATGAAAMAACGATPTATPVPPTATKPPAATAVPPTATKAPAVTTKPVTIQFWFHEFVPQIEYVKDLVAAYKKDHPNVTVEFTAIALKDYTQKLAVAMSTGTAPDLYDLGNWFMPYYAAKKLMDPVPLDQYGWKSLDEARNAYLPGSIEGLIFDNKLLAIPIQMNSFSLFINKRLFTEAGFTFEKDTPKTWDDVIRVAKKINKVEGGQVTVSGFDWSFNGANWHMFMFEPLIHQYGGDILDASGKAAVNSDAGIKALTLMKKVTVDEKIGDPKAMNAAPGDQGLKFRNGKLGLWECGPWFPKEFLDTDQIAKDGYVVVPLPIVDGGKSVTMMYGFAWAVNSASTADNKTVAWDFTRFAASKPEEWINRVGVFQPVKGVWTDSAAAKSVPYLDIYIQDASRARYLVVHENYNEISQAITRAMDKVLLEGGDPKASLDTAAAEINKALGK